MGDTDTNKASGWNILAWVALIGVVVYFKFPTLFSSTGNLYMCRAEIHDISKCSVTRSGSNRKEMDCLFKNNAQVRYDPSGLVVWNYDKDGILLEATSISSSTIVGAGSSVHVAVNTLKNAEKSVVCSMDPNSALIKSDGNRKIK